MKLLLILMLLALIASCDNKLDQAGCQKEFDKISIPCNEFTRAGERAICQIGAYQVLLDNHPECKEVKIKAEL